MVHKIKEVTPLGGENARPKGSGKNKPANRRETPFAEVIGEIIKKEYPNLRR